MSGQRDTTAKRAGSGAEQRPASGQSGSRPSVEVETSEDELDPLAIDPDDEETATEGPSPAELAELAEAKDTWVDETPPTSPGTVRSDVQALVKRPSRPGPDARLGDVVTGRYDLRRVLGSGATGAVYEAIDLTRGERVAIKLLHADLRASDGHVARFSREVRATTTIAHSSVVRILDAGEDRDGTLFLVMELLEGELLLDRIGKGLDVREIVEIGRQLLGALGAAHARGVVHRDIKPENLFLTSTPSGAIRLKVLDFGIAKLVRPGPTISFQTMDGLILGTPAYMSPEVCRGMPVSEAADLWAAAAVLYEAFTGDPPFDDEHLGRLLLKVVKGKAPSLREKRPDLPDQVIEAIDRALHPDLAQRWPTAQDFATALSSGSASISELDWEDL